MYMYMYIHMYMFIFVYIHTHTYIYVYTCAACVSAWACLILCFVALATQSLQSVTSFSLPECSSNFLFHFFLIFVSVFPNAQ